MECERCGGQLVHAGGVPPVASCQRCGKLRVGAQQHTVPQCPVCFGDLAVVPGRLPITVVCPAERRFFYADLEEGFLHPTWDPYPLAGFPGCPACGGSLTFYEDLPPRATCPSCEVDYSLEPLRAAPPCGACGDQVRIMDGAMPPQGDCLGCGVEAVLADAPEPLAPPIEVTVQLVLPEGKVERGFWSRLFGWLSG
ncbi:MAG: hypothetical protein AAF721_07660 [Myxococcota bacterium]